MLDSGRGKEQRYGKEHIPADLTCALCEGDVKPSFKNELGYRGHMAAKHDVFFEKKPEEPGGKVANLRALGVLDGSHNEAPEDPQELKPWQKLAIARHELYGETYAEVAESMGKSPATLHKVAKSPAAQLFKEQIRQLSDANNLVEMLLKNAQLGVLADWMMAFEWAKSARDYKFMHQMVKDVGLQPVLAAAAAKDEKVPQSIVIHLGGATTLDAKPVTSSFTVVDADVQPDDSDGN